MSMPPAPHPGDPVAAAAIRKAVWDAAWRVFPGPPEPGDVVDRLRAPDLFEQVQEALADPLWLGETDVFHDNEPTVAEVVKALLDAARLYGVLIEG